VIEAVVQARGQQRYRRDGLELADDDLRQKQEEPREEGLGTRRLGGLEAWGLEGLEAWGLEGLEAWGLEGLGAGRLEGLEA
jgi:hypothetical protein